MIDQKTMLDIIESEAFENGCTRQQAQLEHLMRHRRDEQDEPVVKYDLRLVREPDGSLKWED